MKKLMCGIIICIIFIFTGLIKTFADTSIPDTVIIIRHADKLPKEYPNSGPALTPKGITRSMAFALFYIKILNNDANGGYPFPNFIFATNPYKGTSDYGASGGYRELLTVSPLVTYLYKARQKKTLPELVDIPFASDEYKDLIDYIYSKKHLDKTTILICWDHSRIPDMIKKLAKDFNITSGEVPDNWKGDDFSTVYILNYQGNNNMKIIKLDASLTYPVSDDITSQLYINQAYYQLMDSVKN
jgi:hypothetical protein